LRQIPVRVPESRIVRKSACLRESRLRYVGIDSRVRPGFGAIVWASRWSCQPVGGTRSADRVWPRTPANSPRSADSPWTPDAARPANSPRPTDFPGPADSTRAADTASPADSPRTVCSRRSCRIVAVAACWWDRRIGHVNIVVVVNRTAAAIRPIAVPIIVVFIDKRP
jgi:hypothetical protein